MKRTKSTFLALVAVLLSPITADADPIEVTFQAEIDFSSLVEIPVGSVVTTVLNYDDNFLTGIGTEDLSIVDQLFGSLSITIIGAFDTVTITDSDDIAATFFPLVRFVDGIVTGFDFVASLAAFGVGLELSTTQGGGELLDTIFIRQDGNTVASASNIVAVPEPGTLVLFGIGLAGMGRMRRRHAA